MLLPTAERFIAKRHSAWNRHGNLLSENYKQNKKPCFSFASGNKDAGDDWWNSICSLICGEYRLVSCQKGKSMTKWPNEDNAGQNTPIQDPYFCLQVYVSKKLALYTDCATGNAVWTKKTRPAANQKDKRTQPKTLHRCRNLDSCFWLPGSYCLQETLPDVKAREKMQFRLCGKTPIVSIFLLIWPTTCSLCFGNFDLLIFFCFNLFPSAVKREKQLFLFWKWF